MRIRESIAKGFQVTLGSMNLVVVLFVFGAIWNVINISMTPQLESAGANPAPAASATVIIAGLFFMLLSVFMQGGSLGYIRERLKGGQADLAVFTASGRQLYLRLFLLGLLVAVIIGALVVVAALAVALFSKSAGIVGILIALLLASLGIYFALLIILAPYAIAVDGSGVVASIKRSVALVRQNILTLLGIIGLLILIGFAVGVVMGALFALLRLGLSGNVTEYLFGIFGSFVNAFLGVVVTGSLMHLYLAASNNTQGA